jgi:hypothetical protein
MPKEVKPPEVAAMLNYATNFHPDLSFLLMEGGCYLATDV